MNKTTTARAEELVEQLDTMRRQMVALHAAHHASAALAGRMLAQAAKRELARARNAHASPEQLAVLGRRLKQAEDRNDRLAKGAALAEFSRRAGVQAWAGPGVTGRIVDADGRAVAGASVELSGPGRKAIASATTDADGYFRLDAPLDSPAEFTLSVAGRGKTSPAYEKKITLQRRLGPSVPHLIRLGKA